MLPMKSFQKVLHTEGPGLWCTVSQTLGHNPCEYHYMIFWDDWGTWRSLIVIAFSCGICWLCDPKPQTSQKYLFIHLNCLLRSWEKHTDSLTRPLLSGSNGLQCSKARWIRMLWLLFFFLTLVIELCGNFPETDLWSRNLLDHRRLWD